MYPSSSYPTYGTFVKNFEDQLIEEGFYFSKAVIYGKGQTKFKKFKKYLLFFKEVFVKVKMNEYDLIYVHYIGHSLIPLILAQYFIKKPIVLNAHGGDVITNSKISFLIQKIVFSIIKKANLIVVPSEYFKEMVSSKFNISNNKIFVSPSGGIDTTLFKSIIDKKINKPFTIGYVSRIDSGKGWNILLDAVYVLNKRNFDIKVIMIGSGSEENILLNKIKNLKLQSIVNYLGAKSHNELVAYFNKMDIFIFPTTLNESLGLVGLEAMACGIPVIGSNIGALPSYIEDGINGKLFEAGNAKILVDKVEYLMSLDKGTFIEYKKNSLKTAKRYNSKIVSKILAERLRLFKNFDIKALNEKN